MSERSTREAFAQDRGQSVPDDNAIASSDWRRVRMTQAEKTLSATPERHEQIRQRYAERCRETTERTDPYVALTSLDATDVVSMKISAGSQFFLRNLSFLSQFANPASHGTRQPPHTDDRPGLNTIGLHTIVVFPTVRGNISTMMASRP